MGLKLSQYHGDSIRIGEQIRITILRVRGGKVTLLIEAPRDQKIVRESPKPAQDHHG